MVFRLILRFQRYFDHFIGLGDLLVNFYVYGGNLVFFRFRGILVILGFKGIFGHFLGFMVILVIF